MDNPKDLENLKRKFTPEDLKMRTPEAIKPPEKGHSNDDVARYVTIAVLGSMIHEGKKVTEAGFVEFYAAVLKDLNSGSMEKSLAEFTNVMNRINENVRNASK